MNYKIYHFGRMEYIRYFIGCVLVILLLAYLFYGSPWYGIILLPLAFVFMYAIRDGLKVRRDARLREEFSSFIRALTDSLKAGFSVENGFAECEKELELLYGKDSLMVKELKRMNKRIKLNEKTETVIEEFAQRTDVEDIRLFSQVFSVANRTGGRVSKMMKMVSDNINDSLVISKEIEVSVYEKKLEQIIMSLVPPGIIMYLRITAADLSDLLYSTLTGRAVMTVCLAVYGLAVGIAYFIMRERQ